MPRFFTEQPITGDTIILPAQDAKHMRVLRLGAGDAVTVCDGRKTDYVCSVTAATNESATLLVKEVKPNEAEQRTRITLYQSAVKGDKMDLIVQKAVELGAEAVIPIYTRYSVPVNKSEKKDRLPRIALEAAKQCGRGVIPAVSRYITFSEALCDAERHDITLMAYEKERETTLKDVLWNVAPKSLGLFIGPEGGFSGEELNEFVSRGAKPFTLGKRILRAETAAICALSVLTFLLD